MNLPRILVIAEAANPEWTSVPLVGWSLTRALMDREDLNVHFVTHIRNREAIERTGLVEGKDFTAIDSDALAGPMYRLATRLRGGRGKGWTTVTALAALSYYWFEYLLWKQFRERILEGNYDLVHRITPLSPTIPGMIAKRLRAAGVPFVVGPINGGVPWPREFSEARRKEKEWLSYVRGAYKWLPGYRSMRRDASAIMVASKDTFKQMSHLYSDKCVYLPENGIDPSRLPSGDVTGVHNPLRVIFVGRLVPYKGADMLIEAASDLLRDGKLELVIVGDGPQRGELDSLVSNLGLEGRIDMAGWLEQREVFKKLQQADVFAFPSIREFGGGVVLEAMAVGCVPMVVDYGGPGELVSKETGFRIPIGRRDAIIAELRKQLRSVVSNPMSILHRRDAARLRVAKYFTWDAKAEQVAKVYRAVIDATALPNDLFDEHHEVVPDESAR